MTAMKMLKTIEEQHKFKVAAGYANGTVILYDLNLT